MLGLAAISSLNRLNPCLGITLNERNTPGLVLIFTDDGNPYADSLYCGQWLRLKFMLQTLSLDN